MDTVDVILRWTAETFGGNILLIPYFLCLILTLYQRRYEKFAHIFAFYIVLLIVSIWADIHYHRYTAIPAYIVLVPIMCLILRVYYKRQIKKYPPKEAPAPSTFAISPDDPNYVSDEDFQKAQRLIEFGVRHPAVKEVAQLKGITPRQVILGCEEIVRNWNLQNRERSMR